MQRGKVICRSSFSVPLNSSVSCLRSDIGISTRGFSTRFYSLVTGGGEQRSGQASNETRGSLLLAGKAHLIVAV